ncbi:TPA: hypothetical protein N0F65_012635 [Lagenidium giganteum]|uniref:Uncharacterized protein n=1 Tax=Lagenidium giganteum TaxID=4803 RepID=A0AAV2YFG7_9STRA|nr:TPA: hypothetical protein N0F65_012635 [Lagenidium giganteum]
MKNTVLTVIFSLISAGCAFFALVYPAWFQQEYQRDGKDVFQGYGVFAFYSTGALDSPFYASKTTLQYSDFCKSNTIPNYMLGNGDQFHTVLCGKAMMSVQATTATGAAISLLGLLGSIIAVYSPSAGIPEKVVSFSTLVGSLLLAVSLVIWGWLIQQRLYQVDAVSGAYLTCKSDRSDWSCWFYGYSFWVCLASVILLSVTGYLSSAGRAEKIRYFRKEYERDLAVAVQQSLVAEASAQQHHLQGPAVTNAYVRSNTGQGFAAPASQPYPPQHQPYGQPGMNAAPMQQPYNQQMNHQYSSQMSGSGYQQPPPAVMNHQRSTASNPSFNHTNSGAGGEMAYPVMREERKNHTLLGPQPNGGVV